MKLNLPICLDFDSLTDMPYIPGSEVTVPVCGGRTCSHTVVFRAGDVADDLRKAFDYWNCMCGVQNNSCQCSIKVKFSDDIDNFQIWEIDPTGSSIMDIYEKPGCQFDCNDLVIYINNTKDFVNADNGSTTGFSRIKGSFYVTSSAIPTLRAENQATGRAPYTSNLTKIVANELGQMLGIGLNNEIGEIDCGWPCNNSSVMTNNSSREWDNVQANPQYDHCAFKKLYCNSTDIESIEDERFDVKVINHLLILTSKMERLAINRITITDYTGRILTDKTNPEVNANKVQVNIKNFSNSRILFIKIETDNTTITKKIIR